MNPMSDGELKKPRESGHGIAQKVGLTAGLLILGLVGFSLYVAIDDAEPQETVLLGQTTLAADSPAGLRILVRNRKSLQPIPHAKVELSFSNPTTGTVKLGPFRTDSSGSLPNAIDIPAMPPGEYQLGIETVSRLGRDLVSR